MTAHNEERARGRPGRPAARDAVGKLDAVAEHPRRRCAAAPFHRIQSDVRARHRRKTPLPVQQSGTRVTGAWCRQRPARHVPARGPLAGAALRGPRADRASRGRWWRGRTRQSSTSWGFDNALRLEVY